MSHRLFQILSRMHLLAWLPLTSCSAFLEFEEQQCTTDQSCESLGPEFSGTSCVAGYCRASCDDDSDCDSDLSCVDSICVDSWECFESPSTSADTDLQSEMVELTVSVYSALDGPLSEVPVRVCSMDDKECAEPELELVTDGQGMLSLSLPVEFEGFLETKVSGHADQVDILPSPLLQGMQLPPVTLQTDEVSEALADAVGASLDDERGHVLLTARNCFGPGRGLTLSASASDESSTLFSFENGQPTTDTEVTTEDGAAGYLNLLPGDTTVRATTDDGKQVLSQEIFVREGTFTVIALYPTLATVPAGLESQSL